MLPSRIELPLKMLPQPDETPCSPTCLHALYRDWGRQQTLDEVIARTGKLERGGTVAVRLACDALRQGFEATILAQGRPGFLTDPHARRLCREMD